MLSNINIVWLSDAVVSNVALLFFVSSIKELITRRTKTKRVTAKHCNYE